jgi:hypothetical protein
MSTIGFPGRREADIRAGITISVRGIKGTLHKV